MLHRLGNIILLELSAFIGKLDYRILFLRFSFQQTFSFYPSSFPETLNLSQISTIIFTILKIVRSSCNCCWGS